jgi:hypothetical protein
VTKEINMRSLVVYLCALTLMPVIEVAHADDPAAILQQEIGARMPQAWQVHVSWRGPDLVAFVTPSVQRGFDLWYHPGQLRREMEALCPAEDDPIWKRMPPGGGVAVQPTVAWKSDDSMRIACRRSGAHPGA